MVFQGAVVGRGSRLGAASIAHVAARLAPHTRLGMRQFAVAQTNDDAFIAGDLHRARDLLGEADFFGRVFDEGEADLELLHRLRVATLRAEANEWSDLRPVNRPAIDNDLATTQPAHYPSPKIRSASGNPKRARQESTLVSGI